MSSALNLKVIINPKAGFCFGVKHAIQIAEEMLTKGEEVYCVGKIVHNAKEVSRLEKMGLNTISLDELKLLHGKIVLFRAHGEPPSTYALAEKNGNTVVDASCKVVLHVQDRIRISFENKENIYIFGKKEHPEMIGILAQTAGTAVAFEDITQLDLTAMPLEISLYSQTTKSLSQFYEIAAVLESNGIKVNLQDTVCRQVHNREAKLAEFAKSYDKNIFVAGKDSSNAKVLFNICFEANPDSFYVSEESEIKEAWFKPHDTVGISGATSTPVWQMARMKEFLENL